MFIVVCYDVSDDKRRRKLHQKLKNFGEPVQYSVFECLLNDGQFQRLKQIIAHLVDPQEDKVRYYNLCHACQKLIELINGEVTREEALILV